MCLCDRGSGAICVCSDWRELPRNSNFTALNTVAGVRPLLSICLSTIRAERHRFTEWQLARLPEDLIERMPELMGTETANSYWEFNGNRLKILRGHTSTV